MTRSRSMAIKRLTVALFATVLVGLPGAGSGQQTEPAPSPDLNWAPGVSEMPLVDFTGTWEFEPGASDPMVEVWRERQVRYVITQTGDRIVLDFRPEDGERNVQGYRWDGAVSSFQRGETEVRERARWIDGGRKLQIEGRWWQRDEAGEVHAYTFVYSLDGPSTLVFEQQDAHGVTVWRFER